MYNFGDPLYPIVERSKFVKTQYGLMAVSPQAPPYPSYNLRDPLVSSGLVCSPQYYEYIYRTLTPCHHNFRGIEAHIQAKDSKVSRITVNTFMPVVPLENFNWEWQCIDYFIFFDHTLLSNFVAYFKEQDNKAWLQFIRLLKTKNDDELVRLIEIWSQQVLVRENILETLIKMG